MWQVDEIPDGGDTRCIFVKSHEFDRVSAKEANELNVSCYFIFLFKGQKPPYMCVVTACGILYCRFYVTRFFMEITQMFIPLFVAICIISDGIRFAAISVFFCSRLIVEMVVDLMLRG